MFRQTPRQVAYSTSSAEHGKNMKNRTPQRSQQGQEGRKQIVSVDSWLSRADLKSTNVTVGKYGKGTIL